MTRQTCSYELSEIVPKARPRLAGNGTVYLPRPYRDNQIMLTRKFGESLSKVTKPAAIDLVITGKVNRRGDVDNIAGSVLDALVHAEILPNDNLTWVTALSITVIHSQLPINLTLTITEN